MSTKNSTFVFFQVMNWFQSAETKKLVVCRIKNKFGLPRDKTVGGYRDLMASLVFEDPQSGLCIIGEIQIHDRILFGLKLKVCNLAYLRQRISLMTSLSFPEMSSSYNVVHHLLLVFSILTLFPLMCNRCTSFTR